MAQHGLSGAIRVKKSESFKMGNKVYVKHTKIGDIFNKRGEGALRQFDKDNFIIHPTKGKLFLLPGNVIRVVG